jgi:hypothetical protein
MRGGRYHSSMRRDGQRVCRVDGGPGGYPCARCSGSSLPGRCPRRLRFITRHRRCRRGIDDEIAGYRHQMLARHVTAGIAIMCRPDVSVDLLLQDHDVAGANRGHAGCRRGARKAAPVRREVQFRNDPPKLVEGRFAATERVRASCRATADDPLAINRASYQCRRSESGVVAMMGLSLGGRGKENEQRSANMKLRQLRTPCCVEIPLLVPDRDGKRVEMRAEAWRLLTI